MIVVTPKETQVLKSKFNKEANQSNKHISIYLGGSIDYDWQSKVISKIVDSVIDYGRDTIVYNPRKIHSINNQNCHEFLSDESWKDTCIKKSDIIVVNFIRGCEDGLNFLSDDTTRDRLVVFCPYDHKHFNTIKYICDKHRIYFVTKDTLDENNILESLFELNNKK